MTQGSNWIVKGKGKSKVEQKGITLKFYASNGVAIAEYTSPTKNCSTEVNSRDHAVALTAKAVQNANGENLSLEILHGNIVESDVNFGQAAIEDACLSTEAYSLVMGEAQKARKGLFDPTF